MVPIFYSSFVCFVFCVTYIWKLLHQDVCLSKRFVIQQATFKKKKCIGYMNLCKSQMPFMLTQITVYRHSTLISKSPVKD